MGWGFRDSGKKTATLARSLQAREGGRADGSKEEGRRKAVAGSVNAAEGKLHEMRPSRLL
jgi:hypothetical protein